MLTAGHEPEEHVGVGLVVGFEGRQGLGKHFFGGFPYRIGVISEQFHHVVNGGFRTPFLDRLLDRLLDVFLGHGRLGCRSRIRLGLDGGG